MATTGIVFDIRRYSIHDGPGIRTTVFLKGCPLRCAWCQNPEGQSPSTEMFYRENHCIGCGDCIDVCEQDAISWDGRKPVTDRAKCVRCGTCASVCFAGARESVGKEMDVDQVMAEVERDTPFFEESGGGATFSGGEPLLQKDFLLALLRACKERGIHTALDTCGLAEWAVLNDIRRHADLFLYDLKLMDDRKHRKYTGVSNELILRNLQELSRHKHNIILRVPIIPDVNDDDKTIEGIGRFASSLPHLKGIDLLPYHRLGIGKYERLGRALPLDGIGQLPVARMVEISSLLKRFHPEVRIGG